MDTIDPTRGAIYHYDFTVSKDVIDANGHVNNVAYVQWMQNLAIHHWGSLGGMELDEELGCTWVARSHHIEYLAPAYEGDPIQSSTWVANFRRVRSLRKYSFRRTSDDKLLARGETDWVFVNVKTGRPHPITEVVRQCLPLLQEDA